MWPQKKQPPLDEQMLLEEIDRMVNEKFPGKTLADLYRDGINFSVLGVFSLARQTVDEIRRGDREPSHEKLNAGFDETAGGLGD